MMITDDNHAPIVIDGKKTSGEVKECLRHRVRALEDNGVTVGLGTILVGDDPGSRKYVTGKHRDCAEVGIKSIGIELPSDAGQDDVMDAVRELNGNPDCTGFIVQLPLPCGINENDVIMAMRPDKDADGLHPLNLGLLVEGTGNHVDSPFDDIDTGAWNPTPCTPKGIIVLLRRYGIDLDGANVCVIGRGITVGRTIGLMLTTRGVNATVDLCHTGTENLAEHVRRADVVISCAGSAGLVKPEWLGDDVVLVDVGVSRTIDPVTGRNRILGDFDSGCLTSPGVRAYTPNPGGVGPMTRAMLLDNVVRIAESKLVHQ